MCKRSDIYIHARTSYSPDLLVFRASADAEDGTEDAVDDAATDGPGELARRCLSTLSGLSVISDVVDALDDEGVGERSCNDPTNLSCVCLIAREARSSSPERPSSHVPPAKTPEVVQNDGKMTRPNIRPPCA